LEDILWLDILIQGSYMMENRRGQLTIFIIFAVLIILVILILIILRNPPEGDRSSDLDPKQFLDKCVRDKARPIVERSFL